MKYTLNGFSQEVALQFRKNVISNKKEKTIKIDCTDLTILRWFVDFYPNMRKMTVDGKEYAWLSHKKLIDDLPILDINKRSCIERMQKLVAFEILEYALLKDGGTFSLYRFGKNYEKLITSSNADGILSNGIGGVGQTNTGTQTNGIEGMQSNDIGGDGQPANKDISFSNSSFSNSSNKNDILNKKFDIIISYLNEKTGMNYRSKNKETQKHINARFAEGFTVEDFKTVIDKKVAEWTGTEWAKFLRPSTLFGTKFESYLNTPAAQRKVYGTSGVQIDTAAEDDLAGYGL